MPEKNFISTRADVEVFWKAAFSQGLFVTLDLDYVSSEYKTYKDYEHFRPLMDKCIQFFIFHPSWGADFLSMRRTAKQSTNTDIFFIMQTEGCPHIVVDYRKVKNVEWNISYYRINVRYYKKYWLDEERGFIGSPDAMVIAYKAILAPLQKDAKRSVDHLGHAWMTKAAQKALLPV